MPKQYLKFEPVLERFSWEKPALEQPQEMGQGRDSYSTLESYFHGTSWTPTHPTASGFLTTSYTTTSER